VSELAAVIDGTTPAAALVLQDGATVALSGFENQQSHESAAIVPKSVSVRDGTSQEGVTTTEAAEHSIVAIETCVISLHIASATPKPPHTAATPVVDAWIDGAPTPAAAHVAIATLVALDRQHR
jgi:hypothetical protein